MLISYQPDSSRNYLCNTFAHVDKSQNSVSWLAVATKTTLKQNPPPSGNSNPLCRTSATNGRRDGRELTAVNHRLRGVWLCAFATRHPYVFRLRIVCAPENNVYGIGVHLIFKRRKKRPGERHEQNITELPTITSTNVLVWWRATLGCPSGAAGPSLGRAQPPEPRTGHDETAKVHAASAKYRAQRTASTEVCAFTAEMSQACTASTHVLLPYASG